MVVVGDFGEQTEVDRVGECRYRAALSADWEIWGPMGGYVAAVAARAAGAEAVHPRPVSFFCHFVGVARFAPVDLAVDVVRRGRSAETLRVSITQEGRQIMDATVAVAADNDGLEHGFATPPDVPAPQDLPTREELAATLDEDRPSFPFWDNFDVRPIDWRRDWPPPGPEDPVVQQWLRFVPRSTFDDPWVDVGRYLLLCDLPSWPAAMRHHAWRWEDGQPDWVAPSIDLYVALHQLVPDEPWLLMDGVAPIAGDGLLAGRSAVWTPDGRLVATGAGQCLFRRLPTS